MAQPKRGGRRTRRNNRGKRTRRMKRGRGGRGRTRRSRAMSRILRNMRRRRNRGKRRTRRRGGMRKQRGGSKAARLYPAPAFPPGGMYKQGSATNGLGKGYYYGKLQKPCLPDPVDTNQIGTQSGGWIGEAIPGYTDARDVAWKAIGGSKNLWNRWWGFPPVSSSDPSVQPIEEASNLQFNPSPDLDVVQRDASTQAAKYKI